MKNRVLYLLISFVSFVFIFGCSDDSDTIPSPPSMSFSFEIGDDLSSEDQIGDISVEDPSGLVVTYTMLASEHSDLFKVGELNGILSLDANTDLDVNWPETYELKVSASNGQSLDGLLSVRVTVLDKDEFTYGKYDDIAPISSLAGSNGWEEHSFSSDNCQCFLGDPFKVATMDNASDQNLIITLQGGGACWKGIGLNCEDQYSSVLTNYLSFADFSLELDNRLEGDWNHVLIPYCDKSMYSGDYSIDYDSDSFVEHFWGFRNSSAGINLAASKFPNVEKIVLTGCSAGGYGTIFVAGLVRHHYPNAEIFIINESGPGILHPSDSYIWETIITQWNLENAIDANCESCDGQLTSWYDDMLKADSKIKIAQYSSYEDWVIRLFMGNISRTTFQNHLLSTTNALHSKYPEQYKRFLINGDSHCLTMEERDYSIDGQSYWDWVMAFVNEDEAWQDVLE